MLTEEQRKERNRGYQLTFNQKNKEKRSQKLKEVGYVYQKRYQEKNKEALKLIRKEKYMLLQLTKSLLE